MISALQTLQRMISFKTDDTLLVSRNQNSHIFSVLFVRKERINAQGFHAQVTLCKNDVNITTMTNIKKGDKATCVVSLTSVVWCSVLFQKQQVSGLASSFHKN